MSLVNTFAGEENLIETLRPAARQAIGEANQIDAKRIELLKQGAAFIRKRISEGNSAELTFVCTHNSRRSQLSQLWAQTAAVYYGLTNVTTYSGGTEATACNPRTVAALRRAGFSIVKSTDDKNPLYLAQISENRPPAKVYSKVYSDEPNPQRDFAAVFACDNALEKCPVVKGATIQLPILFVDPKVSDGLPHESATYDERSRQIAREMFFLMSQVEARKLSSR
ncbi:MAG TPA: protein-tyrosine-phosphatase [Verrucomicrobiae bacterium]|nr:protein-tyrosine-phosphatase [Verrucomicrobiae bacterium]